MKNKLNIHPTMDTEYGKWFWKTWTKLQRAQMEQEFSNNAYGALPSYITQVVSVEDEE